MYIETVHDPVYCMCTPYIYARSSPRIVIARRTGVLKFGFCVFWVFWIFCKCLCVCFIQLYSLFNENINEILLFSYSQVISTSLPFFLVTVKINEEMDRGSSVEHGISISVLYVCT